MYALAVLNVHTAGCDRAEIDPVILGRRRRRSGHAFGMDANARRAGCGRAEFVQERNNGRLREPSHLVIGPCLQALAPACGGLFLSMAVRRQIFQWKTGLALSMVVATLLSGIASWAWFPEGHQIVAIIAADQLEPGARAHVAQILAVPDDSRAVADAMAAASIRPDTEFRADPTTPPWHYISLCWEDTPADMPARCHEGNCVTAKIDEYARRLKNQKYDKWGGAGDLAFLIHFVGDIHQPLHAGSNADRGGTCQPVAVAPPEQNLHYAWDDAVVVALEAGLGTHSPRATATTLEKLYPASAVASKRLRPDGMAWESHRLARSAVYGALGIREKPCAPKACVPAAGGPVVMSQTYMKTAAQVTGRQIAKAGYRLGALLNQVWTEK